MAKKFDWKDEQRHYHRLLVDGEEDDFHSELTHSHPLPEGGHTHAIEISRAYIKVDTELA